MQVLQLLLTLLMLLQTKETFKGAGIVLHGVWICANGRCSAL
jgi:hypothetical protein